MRAAVYLRLSSDRTGDGLGIERQRDDCLALIERRGWSLARTVFTENDTSAAGRRPRPLFAELLSVIRAREVDVVVAWALDRLARTARDRLALVEACRDAQVTIALVRGSDMDPTTPAGRLAIGILGEVAQHEIDQKSDRQLRAAEQAAEHGRWIGGRRAFGYAANGMDIVEAEAQPLREAYASLLAGVSVRAIATEWNRQGLTTAQRPWKHTHLGERSPWRADSVRRVLMNPRNAAIRALRNVERGPAAWPAIVSEETYRAAVALLSDPQRLRHSAASEGRQFLTGIALCGLQGCNLTVHGGGASHGRPIYRCRTSTMMAVERPAIEGTHVNRLAQPVDDYIGRVVVARLSEPDARELLQSDDTREDVPALRDEATALRQRLDSLAMEFADGELTTSQLRIATERIRARLIEVESQLADAGRVDVLGDLVTAEDVAEVWEGLSIERRRAVVNELMIIRLHAVGRGSRTFRPETITIEWRTTASV